MAPKGSKVCIYNCIRSPKDLVSIDSPSSASSDKCEVFTTTKEGVLGFSNRVDGRVAYLREPL